MSKLIRVGVISDTHGLIRPAALKALRGVDHIIHAGDVGSQEVLFTLRDLAPVTAVRGNVDTEPWAGCLNTTETLELGGVWLHVIHSLHDLDLDPRAAAFSAVISGHSHQPMNELRNGVLFFNPGSAGPRRFRLPVALGFLSIRGKSLTGDILILES